MKHKTKRTPAGIVLTNLILDLFKLSNRMLTVGDKLVANLGLTSARWQVLGTIAAATQPQPVAWLARSIGVSRQNIQRIINDLAKEKLVDFVINPHHRRAPLILMTDKGNKIFNAAMHLQAPWINKLSEELQVEDIEATHSVIVALHQKLEKENIEE